LGTNGKYFAKKEWFEKPLDQAKQEKVYGKILYLSLFSCKATAKNNMYNALPYQAKNL
jgi:hypothetical protein